jgi:hypothetical protein
MKMNLSIAISEFAAAFQKAGSALRGTTIAIIKEHRP